MGTDTIAPPAGYTLEDEIKPPEGYELEKTSTWADVPGNAIKDAVGDVKGMAQMGKRVLDPTGLGEAISEGSLEPIKKAAHEPIDQVVGFGKNILDTVRHPIDTLKEHPLNTALNAAPLMGFFGKSGPSATLAEEAIPKVTPAAETIAKTAPLAEEVSPSLGKMASDIKGKIPKEISDPMQQVNEYLKNQYGKVSSKPGVSDALSDILTRNARMLRLKELGLTPGQGRRLRQEFGEERLFQLADLAKEKGITDSVIGSRIGNAISELDKTSGQKIGAFRDIAVKRGAIHDPNAIVNSIREQLDPKYLGKGVGSSEKKSYMKALEDIRAGATDPSALAKKITYLNDYSSGNKLTQATGAMSDVANAASKINNDLIRSYLNSTESKAYSESLKDFGSSKVMDKMYSYRFGREAGGRSNALGDVFSNVWAWGKNAFGNKFMENVSDRLGKSFKDNPGLVKNPKLLTEEVLNEMLKTLDEIGDEFVH